MTKEDRLPKKARKRHYHAFLEIMWITSGSAIVETDIKQYDASEGNLFLFTGYEYHDLFVTSEPLDFEVIPLHQGLFGL
jgi:hypothetical protein